MIHALLTLNWQVFEDINHPAGHERLLDPVMQFGAQDVILLMPLLLLALWIGLAFALPGARASQSSANDDGSAAAYAQARDLGLRCAILAVPAVILALVLNVVVGALVPEPRPFVAYPRVVHQLISHAADGSFPSDHAAIATAIATPLVYYLVLVLRLHGNALARGAGAAARALAPVARLAALVALLGILGVLYIGVARVYVGVHYPGDILGGILCGAIAALVILSLRSLLEPVLAALVDMAKRLRLA